MKKFMQDMLHTLADQLPEEVRNKIEFTTITNKDLENGSILSKDCNDPVIYGFKIHIRNDNLIPLGNISTKHNFNSKMILPLAPLSREPYVELNEVDDQVIIVAEMPGITLKDIDVKLNDELLIISAHTTKKYYQKTITLPSPITGCAKMSYRNGILEIIYRKI